MRGEKWLSSSWPGLSRPSTSFLLSKDVDARHKAGHDELKRAIENPQGCDDLFGNI
jgi:hypothetical protein